MCREGVGRAQRRAEQYRSAKDLALERDMVRISAATIVAGDEAFRGRHPLKMYDETILWSAGSYTDRQGHPVSQCPGCREALGTPFVRAKLRPARRCIPATRGSTCRPARGHSSPEGPPPTCPPNVGLGPLLSRSRRRRAEDTWAAPPCAPYGAHGGDRRWSARVKSMSPQRVSEYPAVLG
jgi:hypothetical protein